MKTITATELARNLSEILSRLAIDREEIVIERNHRQVARLIPGPGQLTALEALADVYRALPEDAAASWETDARASSLRGERLPKGVRDPWASMDTCVWIDVERGLLGPADVAAFTGEEPVYLSPVAIAETQIRRRSCA